MMKGNKITKIQESKINLKMNLIQILKIQESKINLKMNLIQIQEIKMI